MGKVLKTGSRLRGDDVAVWITLGGPILNAAYV